MQNDQLQCGHFHKVLSEAMRSYLVFGSRTLSGKLCFTESHLNFHVNQESGIQNLTINYPPNNSTWNSYFFRLTSELKHAEHTLDTVLNYNEPGTA